MTYEKVYKWLAVMFGVLLFGCQSANNTSQATSAQTTGKKTIYTTFYPVYELTKRVVGDKADVKMIIQGNQEAHGFEMQPQLLKDVQQADVIIYNGAGMEEFVDDLKAQIKDDKKFLDLSQGLTLLTTGDGVNSDKQAVNPHTWLSIKNAIKQLDTIYQRVSSLDEANKSYYEENLKKSVAEFKALDEEFTQALAKVNRLEKYFVVSHAAFNYLAYDYGLKQVAVTGISPEEEPTAKQLKTIADFVKANKITTIFFEGKATPKVAQTLADNTNTKTSTLYTMETLSPEEMAKGYLALMKENLKALVESFNE